MSKLIFIRSYLIIVLLILLVGIGLDRLLVHFAENENLSADKHHLQGSFLYVKTRMEQHQNISAAWQLYQASIQSNLGYPVTLFQLGDFSEAGQFVSGEISSMSNEKGELVYYQLVPNSDYIIALGPLVTEQTSFFTDNGVIAMYYLLIATALFIWLRPLSDDLHQLRSAAIDFGKDDFSTRVKLRKSSSIALVADAFNSMAQRIQELVSAHQDLTHGVSHELKTPLSRFKFSLEIISELDDVDKINNYLKAMKGDVRELDDLIDEMLSYAKFSTRNLQLNLEIVEAIQWLENIISKYEMEKVEINLVLDSTYSASNNTILIDLHLMSRVMHNLIRNALRYAKSQLTITLARSNNQIGLIIDDDGPGIPDQYLEQVFQPFSRLDTSRDKKSGGYGLGLAICQKIVQQHNGTILAEKSPLLGGARFRMNIKDYEVSEKL